MDMEKIKNIAHSTIDISLSMVKELTDLKPKQVTIEEWTVIVDKIAKIFNENVQKIQWEMKKQLAT